MHANDIFCMLRVQTAAVMQSWQSPLGLSYGLSYTFWRVTIPIVLSGLKHLQVG